MNKLTRLASQVETLLRADGYSFVMVRPNEATQLGGRGKPLHLYHGVDIVSGQLIYELGWYHDISVRADDIVPLAIEWLGTHGIEPDTKRKRKA